MDPARDPGHRPGRWFCWRSSGDEAVQGRGYRNPGRVDPGHTFPEQARAVVGKWHGDVLIVFGSRKRQPRRTIPSARDCRGHVEVSPVSSPGHPHRGDRSDVAGLAPAGADTVRVSWQSVRQPRRCAGSLMSIPWLRRSCRRTTSTSSGGSHPSDRRRSPLPQPEDHRPVGQPWHRGLTTVRRRFTERPPTGNLYVSFDLPNRRRIETPHEDVHSHARQESHQSAP
jgi:hypothetical protein